MVFNAVFILLQIGLASIAVYQFTLSLFGLKKHKSRKQHDPQKSFAVIVAAHNEAQVIN